MKTITNIYIKTLTTLSMLLFCSILYCGKEPELRSFKLCSDLDVTDTLLVYDQLFLTSAGATTSTSASTYHLFKTLNYITLEVDQTTIVDCEIPQFNLTVIVKVNRLDAFGASMGSYFYDTLDITYDKTLVEKYKERHTKTYNGGFWYTAEIVSIVSSDPLVLPFVKLSIGTIIERYKDINTTTIPEFLTSSYNSSNTEISVSWDEIPGAEEYDLEWVWYDDYANSDVITTTVSASDIEYSFKNNASRVTIKDNTYQVTPTFERGYLLFRVRAIGYTGALFTHRVEGAWSSQNYGPKISNSSGTSFTNNKDVVYINDATSSSSIKIHEPKLNWQYSSVFAEEGKKKEIIAYFDGSLHNRQTVTKINSDHQSIVGETVYDYLGRPAVNILPAPTFENKLKFYAGFNLSSSTDLHYRRSDFDLDNGSCVNTVNSLSNVSGAAYYYSPENPLAGDMHHEYIPNSNGYPFTLTEYTPDATGRVRRQGGVGSTHQLGTGHETKYYYGRPDQEELDMIFGNSVGHQYHYQKNMVVDPNGQVSISYLDLSGRVIATALAGNSPSNVTALSDIPSSVSLTVDAKSNADLQYSGTEIISNKVITVPMQSDYTINYQIAIPRHTDPTKPELCFDCVYDLVISLKDECGLELLDGSPGIAGNQPVIRTLGTINNEFDTICESDTLIYSFSNDDSLSNSPLVVNLQVGSYTLTKSLKISESALAYYESQFLNGNTSLKTEAWYIEKYLSKIDYGQCGSTCDSCQIKLGSKAAYLTKHIDRLLLAEIEPTGADTVYYNAQFDELNNFCKELCNTKIDICQNMLDIIKADLSPGGQYAKYTIVDNVFTGYGLLDEAGTSSNLGFNYYQFWYESGYPGEENPEIKYLNQEGHIIYVNIDGELFRINDLTAEEYVKYFQPEWLNSIVDKHPEYCKYRNCLEDKASNDYDNNMMDVSTWSEALDSGFLNPIKMTGVPGIGYSAGRIDPFFNTGGRGVTKLSNMEDSLTFKEHLDDGITTLDLSIWELVYASYQCDLDATLVSDLSTCVAGINWTSCTAYLDRMWMMYRAVYQSEKLKIKDELSGGCGVLSEAELEFYKPNFYTFKQLRDSASASTGNPATILSATNAKIAQQCVSNCNSRADDWMQAIKDCDLTDADSALLRSLLIEVCINSCDSEHPFGASNVPLSVVVSDPWKRSFKTVFDKMVLDGKLEFIHGICDINLLNVWSYEHFLNNSSINPTDTNRCDSAWVYAPNCIKEETNPGRKQSMAGGIAIEKPCEKCIDCDKFYQGLVHLQNQYDNVFIDTSNRENVIAANVLNNYFKFNLTWLDYKQFAKRCLGVTDTFSDDSVLYLLSLTYVTYAANTSESYRYKTPSPPKPDNPFLHNTFENSYQTPLLYASLSSPMFVNTLVTDNYLSPCYCKTLKSYWDAGSTDSSTFNDYMSNTICGGSIPSFDFYTILKKCEEAWYSDEKDPPQAYSDTSTWNDFQKESLIQIGLEHGIKVPGCDFDCDPTEHPAEENGWYKNPTYWEYPESPRPTSCDSFIRFLKDLKEFDEDLDIEDMMNRLYYDQSSITAYDTLKLKEITDYFYGNTAFSPPFDDINQFPHSEKPKPPYHGFMFFKNFLYLYGNCLGKNHVGYTENYIKPKPNIYPKPTDPPPCNCLRKTNYCDTLEALFNSYAATKGTSGNYFAYNGWSLVPEHPEYYETLLYKTTTPSCSTSLKHKVSNNKMPFMDYVMKDGCGNSSRVKLSFVQNLSNKIKYGRITSFFNFTPVADNHCDTTHYFNVDVIVTLVDLTTIQTTLRGHVENYKLIDTCKYLPDTNRLCDRPAIHIEPYKSSCREQLQIMAKFHAKKAYQEYLDSVRYDFRQKYIAKCMTGFNRETYTVSYPHLQYHYTLYYYDQADNLIQTVPPVGVDVDASSTFLENVKTARKNNTTGYFPIHTMATRYKYNTLNQLTWQSTPDGGASEFWYDKVGRLVLSRNAKQNALSPKAYSYTTFDALGRIVEVGELQSSTTVNTALAFDPSSLATFINAVSKREVTRTHYDVSVGTFTGLTGYAQKNLRSRVSTIAYYETLPSGENASGTFSQAVHYTYDIHGNVDVLLREMPALANIGQHFKTTHYDYDLVSGKVNQVIYQKLHPDQFAHKYSYDGDNRIIDAFTSTNLIHWDREAHYSYYLHGPLKRTELGELSVQGLDYAYTLHGWLKGVNSTTLQSDRDIGHDADPGSINQFVAKDVFGFSLGYYEGDHSAIGLGRSSTPLVTSDLFTPATSGTSLGDASPNLYNGNIRHMVTAIYPFMPDYKPQARAYHYDQLNRIKDAYTYNQMDLTTNTWSSSVTAVPNYEEHFSYDANGNILTLRRNGTTTGGRPLAMDDFTYTYASGTNQLTHVDDTVTSTNYNDDIDDQDINNYSYDAIGNLIQDVAEEIAEIEWTVYGKIKSITRSGGSQKPNLEYEYSPDGHRVHKKVSYPSGDTINTYYIRDAQGNTMSTYTLKSDTFRWSEAHIYGSSRIGVYNAEKVLVIDTTPSVDTLQTNEYVHIRGKRHYELSNHLGNVLAVVSDRRTGVCTDDEIISYRAEIVSVTDYYAFGSPMPGRQGIPNCHIDTTTTIDSMFVNIINENFTSGTSNFVQISINDNSAVANVTGDELHVQAAWPDNATTYRQVTLVSGMSYTLTFDLVSSASIGSSTMECAILMPGDIQTHVITSGTNGFTFTSSYTGNVDIEFSYITDQDDAYSAFTPSFDIDDVVLREYPLREDFQSYSVGSFVANTAVSPSSTVTNSSGNELTIGATWPNRPTAFKSIYLENGTYTVNFDLNSLFTMGVVNTMECRVHLPGGSVVNQYTSTGNKVFTFVCSTTGWVDFEFAYLTNQNPMYTGWTPSIDIDNALVYRTIVNENFSSSSVGSFTSNVTGGMPTSSLSNPSGVLSIDIDAPFRPATDVLVPVTPGKKYSIDFDIVGFSSHSPATHSVRCRVEMAGYPTQHFVYTTTSSVPTIIVDVPSGFGGTDIRVEIASILSSSALSSNPYIHIDNFVVKEWVGITTTTYDTICSTWDKGYRYGFNSMEKDNEISGNGNSYTTEYRQLDVRLGRWFSRDPIERAFESDYAGFSNNPIVKVDPDGDSDYYTANGEYLGSDGTDGTDIHIVTDQDVINKIKLQRIKSSSDPTYYTYKATLEQGTYFTLPPYSDRQKIKAQMETQSPNQLNEIGGEGFLADNGSTFMAEAASGPTLTENDIIKYAESEIEGLEKKPLGMHIVVNNPTDNAKTLKREWKQSVFAGGATTIGKSYDWHSHPFHVVYAYYPKNGDKILQYSLNKLPPNGEEVISKVNIGGDEGMPNSNPSQHDIDHSGEIAHYVMSKAAGTITRHKNGETTTTLKESVFYDTKAKEKPKD